MQATLKGQVLGKAEEMLPALTLGFKIALQKLSPQVSA